MRRATSVLKRKNLADLFQPTPSLRRATSIADTAQIYHVDFNPRPPCGGRPSLQRVPQPPNLISTHALLAEGDLLLPRLRDILQDFNPRPPCGGRPTLSVSAPVLAIISTHALLAEGDRFEASGAEVSQVFQPTPSLRRATRVLAYGRETGLPFQPTPSLRRAT